MTLLGEKQGTKVDRFGRTFAHWILLFYCDQCGCNFEHITPRDVIIHKKWLTDRKQNVWFEENDLTLVRFTDIEFFAGSNDVIDRLATTLHVR